jgi:pantoate--beta-alanine ligase
MQKISSQLKREGKRIGFVPTMGFLHEGHLSLVRASKKNNDVTVVSIFVNPTQFAPNEDFNNYPRNFEKDSALLISEGTDYLFNPSADEIYGKDFQTFVEVKNLTRKFEGEARPDHFKGVTTIVSILFNIVKPDKAYFGRKDAQQAAVIKRMTEDLKFDVEISIEPIIREPDGLAMSSRNIYLNPEERLNAAVLHKALLEGAAKMENSETDPAAIINTIMDLLKNETGIAVEYIKIVDESSFEEADIIKKNISYYILIAAKIGNTRIIDNELIEIPVPKTIVD